MPPAAPHPEVRVEYDQACIGCGYALRGLPVAGVCPECGMAIARSFRGDRLSAADPDYVRQLFRGATLLLAFAVALVSLWIVILVVGGLVETERVGQTAFKALIVAALVVVVTTAAAGTFRLTAADPENLNGSLWHAGRAIARPGAIGFGAGSVATVLLELSPARNSVAAGLAIALALLGLLATVTGMGLVMHTIARRSGERRLARRVQVIAAVSIAGGLLVGADRLLRLPIARPVGAVLLLGAAITGFGLIEELRSVLKRDLAAARLRRAASPVASATRAPPAAPSAGDREPSAGPSGTLP